MVNSKWWYMVSGFDLSFCVIGAMAHSLSVVLLGLVGGIFAYYTAESRRKAEENKNGQSNNSNSDEENHE